MERDPMFIPEIETGAIGPVESGTPEQIQKRQERHEKKDRLTQEIKRWWQGDAHTHTKESTRPEFGYTEGIYDIEEILKYYQSLGLEFAGFAEHASKPGAPEIQAADGPICQSLLHEARRITEVNREKKFQTVGFSSVEANIMFDTDGQPTLDLPAEVLQQLDIVIASRHAIAREKEPAAIKETLLAAIRNSNVDVIGHPDRYSKLDGDQSEEYEREYWAIWPEIFTEMAAKGKAFDLNMTSQPDKRIVKLAAEAGVEFFLNYDAHDFNQFKWEDNESWKAGDQAKGRWGKGEATDEDLATLQKYKLERLSGGPGVKAILRLTHWIKYLEELGVTPDRVVNSSRDRLLAFLVYERGKKTENLSQLVGK